MENNARTPRKKKSLLRRIFMWTGIFLVLVIGSLIAAPFLFKDQLVQLVKDEANKQLNADVNFGEFGLNLFSSFPDFRFNIENVTIVGRNEFKGDSLLALKELSLDINLMSVINGDNYQVNALRLDNPRINAKVLKDGKANWDIVKPSTDTAKVETASTEPTKYNLRLSSLIIKDAFVIYDDEEAGMSANIEDLDYELKGDFSDELLSSKNDLQIAKTTFGMGGINYLTETAIKAKGDVDIDLKANKYTFKQLEVFLNELGLNLDGFLTMEEKYMDMDLSLKTTKGDFKSILSLIPVVYMKDFEDVKAAGTVALSASAKGIYNDKRYPAFHAALLVENGSFKYPALPKSVDNIFIDAKVDNSNGDLDATIIDVKKFNLVMGGNPINMHAFVKTPISDPDFDFGALGTINLGSIKEYIPLEKNEELNGVIKADVAVKGKMSYIDREQYELLTARGTLEANSMKLKLESLPYEVFLGAIKLGFTNKFVELSSFSARMGKSDIRATGRIDNFLEYIFRDELIKGNFTVNSDVLDINQLTSSNSTSTETTEKPAETTSSTSESSVIEIPDNIDFELTTNLRKVFYDNLILDNVNGKVIMRGERLTMENLNTNTLGGQLRLSGYYDSKNTKAPDVNLNFYVDNFDFATTFKTFNTVQKMAPIAQYASGKFTVSLENFTGKLNSDMEPDLNTITANGVLKTSSVRIGGFGPFVKLGEALKINELKSMGFQNVNFSYKIKDGRAVISPFDVKIDKVKATIFGSHGFDRTIDYTWRMQIPRSLFGAQANSTINGLINQANSAVGTNFQPGETIYVDVIFGGTDTKPTVKTSIKEGLKSTLNEVKEQVVEVVKEKVAEQVDKIMEDARKEADKILADAKIQADKIKKEGYAAADKLVSDVKNPLAKLAAQESMKAAKKETDKKVQKILDDAKAKSDKVLRDAQAKSDAQLKK